MDSHANNTIILNSRIFISVGHDEYWTIKMKNNARTKTILRMASFPTEEESGRGLHPYELSKLKNCKVIYLTFFKKDAMPFEIPRNVNLHIGTFYTEPYPRTKGLFTRLIFQIYLC